MGFEVIVMDQIKGLGKMKSNREARLHGLPFLISLVWSLRSDDMLCFGARAAARPPRITVLFCANALLF